MTYTMQMERRLPPEVRREVYLKAAREMQERGLAQDGFSKVDGRICCVAALCIGLGEPIPDGFIAEPREEIRFLAEELGCLGLLKKSSSDATDVFVQFSLCGWNNVYGRTKEEAVTMFEAAARAVEEKFLTKELA